MADVVVPFKIMIFNLSLDDLCPHPDAGLNFESIHWCEKLRANFPNIKINLFVPAAFARLGQKPYYLTQSLEWCKILKGLPSNYSVGLHGLYHRRVDKKHPNSNNDEFQFLSQQSARTVLDAIIKEFVNAGVNFSRIFRPPGWKISVGAVKELTRRGFIIAGDDKYKKLSGPGAKWVSYNWDLLAPPPKGNVLAYGHTSNWCNNYFNEEKYKLVLDAINIDCDFLFLEECYGRI